MGREPVIPEITHSVIALDPLITLTVKAALFLTGMKGIKGIKSRFNVQPSTLM
jgi:hypothetical protein